MTNIPIFLMPVIVLVGVTLMGGFVYLLATSRRNNRQFADGSSPSSLPNRSPGS